MFGDYQAAQVEIDGTFVSVCSRYFALDGLVLAPIADIEPFIAGYSEFYRRVRRL